LSGPYLYYKSSATIHRLNIKTESHFKHILTQTDILDWQPLWDKVVFTSYNEGDILGTYLIDRPGTFRLLEDMDLAVRDIVEY